MRKFRALRMAVFLTLTLGILWAGGWSAKSSLAIGLAQGGITFVNDVFSSGTGATPATSTHYQMQVSLGEEGLAGDATTLTSPHFQLQPGFLASVPGSSSTPSPGSSVYLPLICR
jgi:hypothetical protein